MKTGLGAELRVFFYRKIRELKTGQRQQPQPDGRNVYLPPDAAANGGGNSVLIAADVDQRRQHKRHHRQHARLPEGSSAGAKDASLRRPSLANRMQRSAPASLIEEVKDYMGIERNLIAQSLLFVLIVGLDE